LAVWDGRRIRAGTPPIPSERPEAICYNPPVGTRATVSADPELLLTLDASSEEGRAVLKALASEPRTRILDVLSERLLNVSEIAEALAIPLSTATLHVNVLEDAGLLRADLRPGERGLQKVCQRVYDQVLIRLPGHEREPEQRIVELSMPVGGYVRSEVNPTCGLVTEESMIGFADDPTSFFEPEHVRAQLLWFRSGFVEYHFPNRLPPRTVADALWLSMEVCSEAPMHDDDWPSDITVWINDHRIGTFTSPADFGGQRGLLTPPWWDSRNSQYGLLKEWRVEKTGSYVDGVRVSDVTIDDIAVDRSRHVAVRVGVAHDAAHVGGLNLFGRRFGNYPQDLVLRLRYHRPEDLGNTPAS
jgi:predicted transcriptional regulator